MKQLKHPSRIVLVLALVAFPALPVAGDVTIPNAFERNTPASATEVNENFSAVATAINENAENIRSTAADVELLRALVEELSPAIRVAVGDTMVGRLLGFTPGSYVTRQIENDPPLVENRFEPAGSLMWSPIIEVLTSKGYVVPIMANPANSPPWAPLPVEGEVVPMTIAFDQPGCVGTPYVADLPPEAVSYFQRFPMISPWARRHGFVFASPDPNSPIKTYYVPANSTTTVQVASLLMRKRAAPVGAGVQPPPGLPVEGTTCVDLPSRMSASPALPNDPAVTGYTPVVGPISLVY